MVADDVVDRNADWEGNSSIDELAINLLGVKLGSLSLHDGVSELAQVQDLGTRNTLSDKSFQGQVDNLSSLLVFGAYITVGLERGKCDG